MQPVLSALGALPEPAHPREQMVCIEVVVGDRFSYEAHFRREEGAFFSVGSARENTIVIPQPEMPDRQLDIFFSRGRLWAEEIGPARLVQLNGIPLEGTRCIQPGACIELCGARLSFA